MGFLKLGHVLYVNYQVELVDEGKMVVLHLMTADTVGHYAQYTVFSDVGRVFSVRLLH